MNQPPYPQHPEPQQPPQGEAAGAAPSGYDQTAPPFPPQGQTGYPVYQLPQAQAYASSGYGPSGYAAFGPRPPVKGPLPTVLNVTGGVLLVAGIGLFVLAGLLFWRAMPTDVLNSDGSPGTQSVAHAGPGETVTATLDPDTHYTIYQVSPQGSQPGTQPDPVEIRTPGGETLTADSAQTGSRVDTGGMLAQGRWSFSSDQSGEYGITMPEDHRVSPDGEAIFYVVVEGGEAMAFFGRIAGGLGGLFGGLFLGSVGGILLLIGIIVGVTRRRRRREYEQFYGQA